jgi:hypothetical protein
MAITNTGREKTPVPWGSLKCPRDEETWAKGIVRCPNGKITRTSEVPSYCPYVTEHVLLGGE